jgi:hypothetical protein
MKDSFQAITIGILFVFLCATLFELGLFGLLIAVLAIAIAVWLAKKTAAHFHGAHTHEGDAAIDFAAPVVLILANTLHPALDGFSWYEVLVQGGAASAAVVGAGIVLHEIFRQGALIGAFKPLGLGWKIIVGTALVGIALGIAVGYMGSTILARYETVIDISVVFAYSYVIAEFFYSGHFGSASKKWIAIGGIVGLIFAGIFL